MAWITPKTNWTADDYYNAGDLNRVENDIAELVTLMSGYGIQPTITTFTARDYTRIEFNDDLNRIEGNIQTLRQSLYQPIGWIPPVTDWDSTDPFSYVDANRLESNLLALYTMLDCIKRYILYCGAFNCGQGNEIL